MRLCESIGRHRNYANPVLDDFMGLILVQFSGRYFNVSLAKFAPASIRKRCV